MTDHLKIAIVGLGTVGASTIKLIEELGTQLGQKTRRPIEIVGISAQDKTKDRGIDLSKYNWVDDGAAFTARADVDVVVELVGGESGFALQLVAESLKAGKHVVTANKASLAHHGAELFDVAEQKNVALRYEGAVGGSAALIGALQTSLISNTWASIEASLNGTCDFILSDMRERGASFKEALGIAEDRGYVEADASIDLDGKDAGHKLALLRALAFGQIPKFSAIGLRGIRAITAEHIAFASELGGRVKLLTKATADAAAVYPCILPVSHPLANSAGGQSGALLTDISGKTYYNEGPGAGPRETAVAVVSDLIQIANGDTTFPLGKAVKDLKPCPVGTLEKAEYAFVKTTDKDVLSNLGGDILETASFSYTAITGKAPDSKALRIAHAFADERG